VLAWSAIRPHDYFTWRMEVAPILIGVPIPLGFWMERAFGFARNHYDRIGHFAQGFVPAILARKILRLGRVHDTECDALRCARRTLAPEEILQPPAKLGGWPIIRRPSRGSSTSCGACPAWGPSPRSASRFTC